MSGPFQVTRNSLDLCDLDVGLAIPFTILIAGNCYIPAQDLLNSDLDRKHV